MHRRLDKKLDAGDLRKLFRYTHDQEPHENKIEHLKMKRECDMILGKGHQLEMQIDTPAFKCRFSLSHPSEFHSYYIKVSSNEDNFQAELPFVKPCKITNNGKDVTVDDDENEKLIGYLHEIYLHLYE